MSENSATRPAPVNTSSAFLAIAVGGLVAGTIDLTQACILFGWDIPLSIAGGLLGPTGDSRWRWDLYSGCPAALFHRLFRCSHLLRCQPEAAISHRVSPHLRPVFRRCGRRDDDPGSSAALRSPRPWPVRTPRSHRWPGGAHGGGGPADRLCGAPIRKIRRLQRPSETRAKKLIRRIAIFGGSSFSFRAETV